MGQYKAQSVAEWISILQVSYRWKFDAVFNLASIQLNDLEMDPVEKIILWKKYNLGTEELRDSYFALITRSDPLTLEESGQLGMEMVHKLYAAEKRYRAVRSKKVHKGEDANTILVERVESIIEDLFYQS